MLATPPLLRLESAGICLETPECLALWAMLYKLPQLVIRFNPHEFQELAAFPFSRKGR